MHQEPNSETQSPFDRIFPKFLYSIFAIVAIAILAVAVSSSVNRGTLENDAAGVAVLVASLFLLGLLFRAIRQKVAGWYSRGIVFRIGINFLVFFVVYSVLPVWRALWYGTGEAISMSRLLETLGFSGIWSIFVSAVIRPDANKS